jgi:hypothetical protein
MTDPLLVIVYVIGQVVSVVYVVAVTVPPELVVCEEPVLWLREWDLLFDSVLDVDEVLWLWEEDVVVLWLCVEDVVVLWLCEDVVVL